MHVLVGFPPPRPHLVLNSCRIGYFPVLQLFSSMPRSQRDVNIVFPFFCDIKVIISQIQLVMLVKVFL